ncbi:MAG TPA: hypothetical protein VFR71_00780 [Methyloceanibacter sp.]|jgi:hypothetical protein|nr:hypothetical protein [Methyloceanibacter sp.]
MVCPGNSLQSGHQPGPDVAAGLEAPLNSRQTHTALTRLRGARHRVGKRPPQNNGRSRYRIAGDPREPTP